MAATASGKICVACGKDVTTTKRMKDADGRYWCVECGTADMAKRKAKQSGVSGGGACTGCFEQFPESKLTKFGSDKLCPSCIKAKTKGPGLVASVKGMFSGGGGGGGDKASKGRLIAMIAIVAVLAVVAFYANSK